MWKTLIFFRENHLGIAPHQPHAPGFVPSDFFLFGHVQHRLDGRDFLSDEDLLAPIHSVLTNLTGDTLRAVFAKRIGRLNCVALNEVHYYR
jgi:hypothetical protein